MESRAHALAFCVDSQRGDTAGHVLTFYDVDFTAIRPRTGCAQRPKGRPGATARGHVLEIEHEYSFVVPTLRRNADAVTSPCGGVDDGPIVRTHEECPAVHWERKKDLARVEFESSGETRGNDRTICQVFGLCLSLANVVDAAVSRVILGFPVPSLIELLAYPLILEIKGCPGAWREG